MPPLTPGVDEPATDWPFISYDPTTYPPLPQPKPNQPTRRERLTRFVSIWIIRTGAYTSAFLGFYVLATGQI